MSEKALHLGLLPACAASLGLARDAWAKMMSWKKFVEQRNDKRVDATFLIHLKKN